MKTVTGNWTWSYKASEVWNSLHVPHGIQDSGTVSIFGLKDNSLNEAFSDTRLRIHRHGAVNMGCWCCHPHSLTWSHKFFWQLSDRMLSVSSKPATVPACTVITICTIWRYTPIDAGERAFSCSVSFHPPDTFLLLLLLLFLHLETFTRDLP